MSRFALHAIDSDNNLYMWGRNDLGQLGNGTVSHRSMPVKTIGSSYSEIINVDQSTFSYKLDGSIWCWGGNAYGQLGINNTVNRSSPVLFSAANIWTKISYDFRTCLAIRKDGTLWGWGDGREGTIGNNSTVHRSSPVLVSSATDWADCAVGWYGAYALKKNGTLWVWGTSQYGSLGNNTNSSQFGFGRSSPAQLGTATDYSKIFPMYPGCCALKNDGTLWIWGALYDGMRGNNTSIVHTSSPVLVMGSGYTDVIGGYMTIVAKKNDGTIWTWGKVSGLNNLQIPTSSPVQLQPSGFQSPPFSQLNVGGGFLATYWGIAPVLPIPPTPTAPPPTPTPTTTPAPQLGLFVWGNNTNGCLGLNDTVHRSDFIQLGTEAEWSNTRVKNISTSDGNHTIAVKYDGTIWGWGDNTYGQLGNGDRNNRSSPIQIGTDSDWANAVTGAYYTMAVKTDGSLWTWGRNVNGYLGNNQGSTDQPYPFRIGLENNWSANNEHICAGHHAAAIKTNGTLWVWGYNGQGQLGDNSIVHRSSPVQIAGTNWAQVSVGGSDTTVANSHTVAVKTDGTLWTWGFNSAGQLGINSTVSRSSPTQVAGTDWKYAKASFGGTVAVKTNGTLWTWGDYFTNGLGTYTSRSSPVQITTSTTWETNYTSFDAKYKSAAGIDPTEFYVLRSWGEGTDGAQDANKTTLNISPDIAGAGLNWKAVYQGYSRAFGMSDAEMAFAGPILDLDPRNYSNGQNWLDVSGLSNNGKFPYVGTYGVNSSNINFLSANAGAFYPMGSKVNTTYPNLLYGNPMGINSSKTFFFNNYVKKFSFEIWVRTTPNIITNQSILITPAVTIQLLTNGKIRATLTLQNGTVINCDSTNSYFDFNFHQIVVTHSSTTLKLYIDGILDTTATTGELRSATSIFTVAPYSPVSKIKGWYNVELTSSEISTLYSNWLSIAGYTSFSNIQEFDYTGLIQTWVCPAGVTQVCVGALAGKGGNATDSTFGTIATGGSGGSTVGILPVTPGTTYYIVVGGSGEVSGATYGFGGSGASGLKSSSGSVTVVSGRGGGLAGMFTSNTPSYADALIVAGGGGGGGQVPATAANGGIGGFGGSTGGYGGIENGQGEYATALCYTDSGCTIPQYNTGGIVGGSSFAPASAGAGSVPYTGSSTVAGGNGQRGQVRIASVISYFAVCGGGGAGANGGSSGGISCSANGLNATYPSAGSSCGIGGGGGGATYVKNTATARWHLGFNSSLTQHGKIWLAY